MKALSGLKAERKLSEARVAIPASERLKALAQRRQGEVDGSEERARQQAVERYAELLQESGSRRPR